MKRKLMLGAVLVAVLATAGATYAWASAGATTQTINACINGDGFLRLVANSGNCRRGETPISWNTAGPAGATGATGAQGVAGRDGRDGQTGPQGPAGPVGVNPPEPDDVAATVSVTGQKTGSFSQTPIEVSAISHEVLSPRDPASGLPMGSPTTSSRAATP